MTTEQSELVFAHFSDIHMTPLDGFSPSQWNVKRALGYLNWHRRRKSVHRPDVLDALVADWRGQDAAHLVVTGDLVNIGLRSEYEIARQWLDQLGAAADVTVVPGNHDIYVRLGPHEGIAKWRPFMVSDAYGAARVDGVNDGFPFVRRIGPVGFIGCNSSEPTPPFVAAGRVGAPQIHQIRRALQCLQADGMARVILIHHPPLPNQAPPRRALQDAASLQALLRDCGADLVLHGHNHADTLVWADGPVGPKTIPVVGIASSSAARSHHGEGLARYNLIKITKRDVGFRIDMRGRGLKAVGASVTDLETIRLVAPAPPAI